MIIKLDLKKSYGIQNLDVAKKNKIEKITLNKNIFESTLPESPVTKTVSLESSDNTKTEVISTSFKNLYMHSDDYNKVLYTSKFPSYIGDVLFKSYDLSIDTSQPEYSELSGILSQIPIDVKFSGRVSKATLSSHLLSTKTQDWSGEGYQYGLQYQELLTKLEELDIVSSFDSISTNGFWGKTDWDYTNNIINNTYNNGETNAYNEICETIQRGADETSKDDDPFLQLLECFYPKIQSWSKNGDILNIRVQLPYAVYFFESSTAYQQYYWGGNVTNNFIYEDSKITKYQFDSATIFFETSGNISTEKKTYYDGSREYNAPDSFLFSDSAYKNVQTVTNGGAVTYRKNYYECFADELHEAYQNGKMRFSLKYPVSGVVDIMGFPVLYSQQTGLIRQIGERYFNEDGNEVVISDTNPISKDIVLTEGVMCVITNGDDVVFKNNDNSPKQFYVQNSNLEYNGMAINSFDLVESSQQIKSNFDSMSWAEIDALGEIGMLGSLFNVGDTKMIYVTNNARVSYLPVRILGFNHDMLSDDAGFAGMTLGMDFVFREKYPLYDEYDSNASWKNSDFRSTYLQNIVNLLPDDLVSVVRPVNKTSAIGPRNFQTETTSDSFFLLSFAEIVGNQFLIDNFSTYHLCPVEGTQYEYWRTVKDGLVASDRQKLDYYTRSDNTFVPVQWVSRSVVYGTTASEFSGIDANGEISTQYSVPSPPSEGISLAFCVGKYVENA